VRNEEKEKISVPGKTSPKNTDLPNVEIEPSKKSTGKVVQTVFQVGKQNIESNTMVPIPINGNEMEDQDEELKKSGSNLD
jgi:hypothetical protein